MSNENKEIMRRSNKNKKQVHETNKKKFNWNWFTWKLRNKIISIVLLIILLFGIFFIFIPTQRSKDALSFLIVGVDTDSYRTEEYNDKKPHRTDAIMVATFNPKTYDVEITSIPRDTSVDYMCSIQDREVRGPINEIYELSGRDIGCLRESVSNFLNVPIDYYALIDMSQLAKLVDSVGGIELQVHAQDGSFCQVTTDVSKKYCFTDGEVDQMDGEEAITYARFRKDSEKDYGRGRRQQQVISAILSKLADDKQMSITAVPTILDSIKTDIPPVLLANYYTYFKHMSQVGKMVSGEVEPKVSELPKAAWERIFKEIGLNESSVNESTVKNAINKIKTMPQYSASPLQLFFTNHQFVNDTYAGYYVTPDDQRYEISNALRKNLGLSEATPPEFKNEFGRYELPTDEQAYLEGIGQDYINSLPDANTTKGSSNTNTSSNSTTTSPSNDTSSNVNHIPVISGPDQYTISVGENFVPNLVATDTEDGNVNVNLVSGSVNNQVPGTYTLVYQATDSTGQSSQKYYITVTVVGNNQQTSSSAISPDQVKESSTGAYIELSDGCYSVITNADGTYSRGNKLESCPVE